MGDFWDSLGEVSVIHRKPAFVRLLAMEEDGRRDLDVRLAPFIAALRHKTRGRSHIR